MALDTNMMAGEMIRQAQKQLGEQSAEARFAGVLYSDAGGDDIEALGPVRLTEQARDAFAFIATKPRGKHKIRARRVPAGANETGEATVIEILNDDMPFLVDSTMGEVQARGLGVRLILHPIFRTHRDAAGRLRTIVGTGDRDWDSGSQESFITVRLDAIPEAAADALVETLSQILAEVRLAVADWRPMMVRLRNAIAQLESAPTIIPADLLSESITFLKWLADDHFTVLGALEFRLAGDAETGDLVPVDGTGLGLLRDPALRVLRRGSDMVAMTPEIRRFFFAPSPLIITKADENCRVHRRVPMDYVGIKLYDQFGQPAGELRFIGLFTSQAYVQSPRQIPFLRHKVESILSGFGYPAESHAGKALLNILDTFPRDELFQMGVKHLQEWAAGMLDLELRPRVRVFARVDRFDRFVSALVYAPRDRFTTTNRERIGALLSEAYHGSISAFYPTFPEGPLARVHFIIRRGEGPPPEVAVHELERQVSELVRTWDDRLAEGIARGGGDWHALQMKYAGAFSAAYAETFPAARALEDITRIERLGPERPVAIEFYREAGAPANRLRAAVYRFGTPIRLSERVPVLENLGFSVIDERSYRITPRFVDGVREVSLHDMVLETANAEAIELERHARRLEDCFVAVFGGDTDNDPFNRLVIAAGADWREVAVMRAYAAYLRQLESPFGLRYIAETLYRHAGVTRDLLELFHLRFNSAQVLSLEQRESAQAPIRQRIEGALANVPSLDEDRILRHLHNLVSATLRTNFYQTDAQGRSPQTIAFKFSSKNVEAAPQPRPFREIWVYAPRVEGIHLRFAPIARGGIRWSDRAQDFRTEVLGLVKAQLVKNAVIVPSGAKGGFLAKQLPRSGNREQVMNEGIAAYRIFVSSLLDITDNLVGDKIVPPAKVVRHEGDDPYLVVAADKGTATFSDFANEISIAHGHWLGDAFASGGSAGYDHKNMAITSRGAWECVKRHFRELDKDIQKEPFRVIGVGDMSGDVFGNAMLLSPAIRLVAAFDHRHIFIDPEPDPASSFAERKRLFELPRSSWQDYDKMKISAGGGVFSRTAKAIPLSPAIRSLLKIEAETLTPVELIRVVLQCETELLWFGGIGTYVRATAETDAQVGDRSNDALRITASEVRARVIGEGANLGLTQRARIEFASRGGRINTDFVDNSAGVNCSDQEVNIKIALGGATQAGRISPEARKDLLTSMTGDVAAACLRNNYQQSLALSLAERRGARDIGDLARLMRALEERGLLDRGLEAMPTDAEMSDRLRSNRGLTRPELAILLSYSKIALSEDLLHSRVTDEPELEKWLFEYFPPILRDRYAIDIQQHRLRREIISTALTNAIINRGGPSIAVRLADETGRSTADAAHAFLAVHAVYALPGIWARIDALDGRIAGRAQLDLYQAVQDLIQSRTLWFLRDGVVIANLANTIQRHQRGIELLRQSLDGVLSPECRQTRDERAGSFVTAGVPVDLAGDVAALDLLQMAPVVTQLAEETGISVADTAHILFAISDYFRMGDVATRTATLPTGDYYDHLALAQAQAQLSAAQMTLARAVIRDGESGRPDVNKWLATHGTTFARAKAGLDDIVAGANLTVSRLIVATAQLRDLAEV
jgi:glutamate dehydrogenase